MKIIKNSLKINANHAKYTENQCKLWRSKYYAVVITCVFYRKGCGKGRNRDPLWKSTRSSSPVRLQRYRREIGRLGKRSSMDMERSRLQTVLDILFELVVYCVRQSVPSDQPSNGNHSSPFESILDDCQRKVGSQHSTNVHSLTFRKQWHQMKRIRTYEHAQDSGGSVLLPLTLSVVVPPTRPHRGTSRVRVFRISNFSDFWLFSHRSRFSLFSLLLFVMIPIAIHISAYVTMLSFFVS